jgi:hypothetical protein
MERTDREIIEGYFERLRSAEKPARDAEADALIASKAAAIPGALYYVTQAAVVSEHALVEAQNRIQALEHELSRKSGGLFGSLFGSPASRPPAPLAPPGVRPGLFSQAAQAAGPWGAGAAAQRPGFLATAMQTAVGVAGGMMLGNLLSNMLAPAPAAAAEPEPQLQPQEDLNTQDEEF